MATLFQRQQKKGKTWIMQWREGGKVKTRTLGPLKKHEAQLIKSHFEANLLRSRYDVLNQNKKSITLTDLKEKYVTSNSINLAPETIKIVKRCMNSLIATIGDITLDKIDLDILESWRNERLHSGLKKVSINIEHRQLKAVFSWAVDRDYIVYNPFKKLRMLTVDKKIPPVLPKEHIIQFFKAVDHPQDKAYFLVLYYTGCRPREAFAVTWNDFNPDKNTLQFRDTKGNKDRVVYLHPNAGEAILRAKPKNYSLTDRIFTRIWDKWAPSKRMNHYLKKAKLPMHYSPKWFRHTYATLAINLSKDHFGVQDILGHSSITVTENYTHYELDHQRAIINQLPDPLA